MFLFFFGRQVGLNSSKIYSKIGPNLSQNHSKFYPKCAQNCSWDPSGHPRGFRARFGARFRLPGLPPKKPWGPPGSPKRAPGRLRTPPRGAARENVKILPGTPKAEFTPARLWDRFGSMFCRFGTLFEAILGYFWSQFRNCVKKVRPSLYMVKYSVS